MPQIGIFIKNRHFPAYASLPAEAQKRVREKAAEFILQELNILPKK